MFADYFIFGDFSRFGSSTRVVELLLMTENTLHSTFMGLDQDGTRFDDGSTEPYSSQVLTISMSSR
jgi:hypothetical protein